MPRKKRNDQELREASDHLFYEFWMLDTLAKGLASGIAGQGPMLNALLESFVVHVRTIIDFLYPTKPKNDEVIAEDFFPSQEIWRKLRPDESAILGRARIRAHKEVAHLTYARQKVVPEQKGWNFLEIANEIQKVIEIFLNNVDKNLLGARWGNQKR